MKKNLVFLAVAAIGFAGCNGGFKKSDGGLLYNIVDDKSGTNITNNDFVSANVIAKTDADSVLFSTYDTGHPAFLTIPAKLQSKGDIYSAMMLLSEGDSAEVKVNADSLFKKGMPKPQGFKGKFVIYEIKINKVISKGKLSDQVFGGRIQAYFKTEADKMKAAEPGRIQKYIADHKINATKSDSGLYYQITKQGSGPLPAKGDTVVVNYTGRFVTNGKVFETSDKAVAQKEKVFNPMAPYKPIHIPVGINAVIKGWDQGLMMLNKGAQATLVIPSNLAYGEQGFQAIGPYTPLAFDVEVIDIIHPNPNAPKPVMPQLPGQPSAK